MAQNFLDTLKNFEISPKISDHTNVCIVIYALDVVTNFVIYFMVYIAFHEN